MAADRSVVEALGKTEVTEQGGTGIGFHLILSGTASVPVNGAGRPDLGPGQYFGEISLIDGQGRSATVTSNEALRTISLVSWSFTPHLDEEAGLAKAVLIVMCARLRAAESS
jgi:CRP/FNR family transcriptional regulator, cyclic AMP receptor protein